MGLYDVYSKEEEDWFKNKIEEINNEIKNGKKKLYVIEEFVIKGLSDVEIGKVKVLTYLDNPGDNLQEVVEQARLEHLNGNNNCKSFYVASDNPPNIDLRKIDKAMTYLLERDREFCDQQYGVEEVFYTNAARNAIRDSRIYSSSLLIPPSTLGAFRAYVDFGSRVLFGPLNREEERKYLKGTAPKWMMKAFRQHKGLNEDYFNQFGFTPQLPTRDILLGGLLNDMAVTGLFKDKEFVEEIKDKLYEPISVKDKELREIGLEGRL